MSYSDMRSPIVHNQCLFWGNVSGLIKMDIMDIDFLKDPNEIQEILPELVWSDYFRVDNMLYNEDDIFFLMMSKSTTGLYARLNTVLPKPNLPFLA